VTWRDEWNEVHELREFLRLVIRALEKYLNIPTTKLHLHLGDKEMYNYQLNEGDSVVVTVTDTDDVTGSTVTPDAGSVAFVLSNTSDSAVLNADGTITLTSGTTLGTGNTITVSATVGGVASSDAVGTYDVVAAVVTSDATTLTLSFGTESAPTSLLEAGVAARGPSSSGSTAATSASKAATDDAKATLGIPEGVTVTSSTPIAPLASATPDQVDAAKAVLGIK
jgi:hypothetical protein